MNLKELLNRLVAIEFCFELSFPASLSLERIFRPSEKADWSAWVEFSEFSFLSVIERTWKRLILVKVFKKSIKCIKKRTKFFDKALLVWKVQNIDAMVCSKLFISGFLEKRKYTILFLSTVNSGRAQYLRENSKFVY